jgi:hypothetical protein
MKLMKEVISIYFLILQKSQIDVENKILWFVYIAPQNKTYVPFQIYFNFKLALGSIPFNFIFCNDTTTKKKNLI